MTSQTSHRTYSALSRLAAVLVVLSGLSVLAYAAREPIYLSIAGNTSSSPLLSQVATAITEPGLLALVLVTAAMAVWAWLRDRSVFWRLAPGGVGVVGAYGFSEMLKLVFTEERPCRAFDVVTVLACPAAGDWSWPSNHSVIAAAFATACVLAWPRCIWFAVPGAVLIALSRVAVGAHYLHDVLAGLGLGFAVVLCSTAALRPLAAKLSGARSARTSE